MTVFTEYRDVQVSVDPHSESVTVSLRLPASALDAWRAITDPPQVRRWFGTLWGTLSVGATPRLDFGDGDFFGLVVRRLEPPHLVEYDWRFLGIAPPSTIRWTVRALDDVESEVSVTDRQPGRDRAETLELAGGWADFCTRLGRFVSTGAWSRYPWRDEIEASIVVAAPLDATTSLLDDSESWLPSFAPSMQVLDSGRVSRELLKLAIGRAEWQTSTDATVRIRARNGETLLSAQHRGFRRLPIDEGAQRRVRQAAVGQWIRALEAGAAGASVG